MTRAWRCSIAPAGTCTVLQWTVPITGGISYDAWFPAGGFFNLDWQHTHDEYVSVINGKVTFTLMKEVYNLESGDYVVITRGIHHFWNIWP